MKPATHRRPISEPSARMESHNDQTLSDLIGDVYDAALDHCLWPNVLERLTQFVGGIGATLASKDTAALLADVHYNAGIDQHYKPLHLDKYVTLDPVTNGQFFAEAEQAVATADLMPYDESIETRFHTKWKPPQGLIDFVTAILDKSATSVAMFGVFRHERNGVVDDEIRRRMRLIVPHIRRAVLIGRMFDLKAAEAATFADTLDGLSAAMYLVDSEGRIVHANVAGHAILAAGDILGVGGGRLVAHDAQVSRTLEEVFAAAGQGDAALSAKGNAIPLIGKGGERYVGHVLPLISGVRRNAGIAYTAVAALFVRKANLVTSSRSDVIGKAFKLTKTELRVLHAIVEIGGVPDVAAALGVADTTVRTHLGRLFEKTGTTRQADLVKFVVGYETPLAKT